MIFDANTCFRFLLQIPNKPHNKSTFVFRQDLLPYILDLYSERWNSKRTVVDLDWSPIFPELLLAAYSPNEELIQGPAGCCMVWNLKFPTRGSPEFRFHCNEPITAAAMVRFHPNLVIGGTYSGQVVLWDSR